MSEAEEGGSLTRVLSFLRPLPSSGLVGLKKKKKKRAFACHGQVGLLQRAHVRMARLAHVRWCVPCVCACVCVDKKRRRGYEAALAS